MSAGSELRLDNHKWTVGRLLPGSDRGGFGTVYLVTDEQGTEAVAKLVEKIPAAQRELLMGESAQAADYHNVIPVLDQGEHGNDWVIVMPRADMSLAGYLKNHPPPLPGAPFRQAISKPPCGVWWPGASSTTDATARPPPRRRRTYTMRDGSPTRVPYTAI